MDIQTQLKIAKQQIDWISEYKKDGDPYQQKRAINSLFEVITTLAGNVDKLQSEINNFKNNIK